VIIVFIILKQEKFSVQASAILRLINNQDISLASSNDLQWIGFSYLAFRLMHVLRDFQSGRILDFSLGEFLTYVLFLPTFPAGPIDRSQRFVEDLRKINSFPQPVFKLIPDNLIYGIQRILWGILKKFILADSLALIALNPQNALQIKTSFWMWVALYAYSLRLFFDFSGYTDIAIGLGKLLGINLPENFQTPYLKSNLTTFWNSWHITLTQWFRIYFFNPLTRMMRVKVKSTPSWLVILTGQFSMMTLIGLWHGISWNFVGWGLWHALGLFINNRWSEWFRKHGLRFENSSFCHIALLLGGWLITFNFVTLGWVWFALPNLTTIQHVFARLFGI
jgi:D-alanyl-lipoteichoic acid acyltransferase DltB (MBOAT superfamily)